MAVPPLSPEPIRRQSTRSRTKILRLRTGTFAGPDLFVDDGGGWLKSSSFTAISSRAFLRNPSMDLALR
jgi:hypothetical protein